MSFLRHLVASLLLVTFTASQLWALTPEVQALVEFETKANAAGVRSSEAVKIQHYEIPVEAIEKNINLQRTPQEVMKAFFFQKDGKSYIRWVINPEDTKWYLEIEKWLQKEGIPVVKGEYFTGYKTASRSYILEDPQSGYQFSLKSSTNRTGGAWRDKKQTMEDAWHIRIINDFVSEELKKYGSQNLVIMEEPASFGLKAIDQGLVVRLLGGLNQKGNYYLPGFSALQEEVGKKIAEINGSKDPAQFWNDNYNKPLAKALSELLVYGGAVYDSPHSQNFLIELDAKMKPTGRIVLRDFGDVNLWTDFFDARGRSDIPAKWEADCFLTGRLDVSVGLLHGNTPPGWLSPQKYDDWARDFFKTFAEHFEKVTGIPAPQLAKPTSLAGASFSYSTAGMGPKTAAYGQFLEKIKEHNGLPATCRMAVRKAL